MRAILIMVIKDDWQFQRCANGIKLIKPNKRHSAQIQQLANIKDLPLNIYFLDRNGHHLYLNEQCAEICGFASRAKALGQSLLNVSRKESALHLLNNCKTILRENSTRIFDEVNDRKDGASFSLLSIKMPWIDETNQVQGTLGCSIVLNKHALAESLTYVAALGLLTPALMTSVPKQHALPKLSEKETLSMHYLCKGLTLKEIGKRLSLSPKTIETYLMRAKTKLGSRNKAELIAAFLQLPTD